MKIRVLALATIVAGLAVLAPPPAAAEEDTPAIGGGDGTNPPVRKYYCTADTNGDGMLDMTCWGYNGCAITSGGCNAW